MRLEHFPILLGLLVGVIGVALIADAWLPNDMLVSQERRRRQRAERHRAGEALVGVGTLCLAAALIGRDTWRYGTLSVLIGTVLLVAGGALNHQFLREVLFFRGPARRTTEGVGQDASPADVERDAFRAGNAEPGDRGPRREDVSRDGDSARSARRTPPSP